MFYHPQDKIHTLFFKEKIIVTLKEFPEQYAEYNVIVFIKQL